MRFANPLYLVAVLAIPLLGFFWAVLKVRRDRAMARLSAAAKPAASVWVQGALFITGLVFLALACARPQWGRTEEKRVVKSRNVVIALDVSQSMLAADVRPNRLERAKADVGDLIDSLKGDRCAIVAFRKTGELMCPLTTDRRFLRARVESLNTLSLARGETDIGAGIRAALDAIGEGQDAHSAIIVISDGGDLRGDALKVAAKAKERGVPIFTVGIGDPKNETTIIDPAGRTVTWQGKPVKVKLESEALEKIAEASGGKYVPLATAGTATTTLGEIYQRFLRQVAAKEQNEEENVVAERYQLPLLAAVVLLLAGAALSKGRFSTKKISK